MTLDSPFLVEAGADLPGGRRVDTLAWEGGEITIGAVPAGERLDGADAITLPGLVCGHVEPAFAILPGFPARPGEDADARALRLASALEPSELAAAARLCAAEAALAGTAVVYALHRAPVFEGVLDVLADAFGTIGIRIVAAVDVDERRAGVEGARAAMRENVRFARACAARDDAMAGAMTGLADPDGLPTLLGEVVAEARRAEMSFHLVLGGSSGARRRLAEKAAMRPGSVAVLAAPLDEEERALLRDLQVFPVVTPRSDAARGRPPAPLKGLARHAVLGGWDALADPLAERGAYAAASAGDRAGEAVPAWRTLANGWELAAETLDRTFGRWSEGAPADLAVFEAPAPGVVSGSTAAAHVERLTAQRLRHLVVNGRVVVRDGALANERAIREDATRAAAAAWARAARGS